MKGREDGEREEGQGKEGKAGGKDWMEKGEGGGE